MMPPSESHSTVKEKVDSSQPKVTSCSSDLTPFVPDHDFHELLWENGQVVMQAQSNRPKKGPVPTLFSPHSAKPQDKEGKDAVIPKSGRNGVRDSVANDCLTVGPSGHIGVSSQDYETAPWMNYPIDDYCSEFLSEFSGVHVNSMSTHSTSVPVDRIVNFSQLVKGAHNFENGNTFRDPAGGSDVNRMRNSQLLQPPHQCQTLAFDGRVRDSGVGMDNGMSTHQGPSGDLPTTKMLKQDLASSSKPMQPSSTMNLMNFSHFSRPVALAKANLQSAERLRSNEMTSAAFSSNPMGPTLIEPANSLRRISGVQGQPSSVTAKANVKSSAQPPQEIVSVEHSEVIRQEVASRNNEIYTTDQQRSPDQIKFLGSSSRLEKEKVPEPIIASSSMCSGNGAVASSTDPKARAKRKSQEGEESGYQSEQDIEDDSMGVKKPDAGRSTTTKRSRAAEVHNLSERKRRDRINEKMRALQELIPNCNKVDKASMLDEAIEYLKTLQMQVQIMSMGGGLCMPPMMLSAGMQHIRSHHMGPFSPMGVGIGMGMGLGYGMGMIDMASSPLIPVPPMHGPQFPCSSIPGTPGLHGMPGSNRLQMFGIPGQGLPISMPHALPIVPLSGFPTKVNPIPEVSAAEAIPTPASDSGPSSSSKNQLLQTLNGETALKASLDNSNIQTSA